MDLFHILKKQESKQGQSSVQKLLEQSHSDRILDSRIRNRSINFILKGFPVTHSPELSARSQAIISSVTSNWVFICWTLSSWLFHAALTTTSWGQWHTHIYQFLSLLQDPTIVQLLFQFWAQTHHFSILYFSLPFLLSSKGDGRKEALLFQNILFPRKAKLDVGSLSSSSDWTVSLMHTW